MPDEITVWEKDPALIERLTTVPKPDVTAPPLAFNFFPLTSPLNEDRTTPEFRYWTAAATLRRAADFWADSSQKPNRWRRSQVLDVYVDRGDGLNSEYDGQALNFYHGSPDGHPTVVVYSGESPDLLCHELGHAVLDAVCPDCTNRGLLETDAFIESFGDMSAILCALQIPTYCSAILRETKGRNFWSSSSLSRIAEQFGMAVRLENPNEADEDCLRNAWNEHFYVDPDGLDPIGPPDTIAANAHSFSRVFTGALFEALAGMLPIIARGNNPGPEHLQQVSAHMRDILLDGAKVASLAVVPRFFTPVLRKQLSAQVGHTIRRTRSYFNACSSAAKSFLMQSLEQSMFSYAQKLPRC
jgi:hypothetical protein